MWEVIGETESVHKAQWPVYDESKLVQQIIPYQIHINGKMRDIISVSGDSTSDMIQQQALDSEKVKQIIGDGQTIKKVIVNQEKNIVIIIC